MPLLQFRWLVSWQQTLLPRCWGATSPEHGLVLLLLPIYWPRILSFTQTLGPVLTWREGHSKCLLHSKLHQLCESLAASWDFHSLDCFFRRDEVDVMCYILHYLDVCLFPKFYKLPCVSFFIHHRVNHFSVYAIMSVLQYDNHVLITHLLIF